MTSLDFRNHQEIKWCPGCGDYAVLKCLQKTLAQLSIPTHETVFISGIGCASRMPYYLNAYGFHTIHGRAPAIATGLKVMRPDLSVWIITGDGDGLSIGMGHLLHLMRRNVDVNILLLNNGIYGLTKGQSSPTSSVGQVSKTTPSGNAKPPMNPLTLALSAGASFIARALDTDLPVLSDVMAQAVQHTGTSFIEVWQNCPVFNDGAFAAVAQKAQRAMNTIGLKAGEPLQVGEQGLQLQQQRLAITPGVSELIHEPTERSLLTWLLAEAMLPDLPVPMGVLLKMEQTPYPCHQHVKLPDDETLLRTLEGSKTWEYNG